MRMKISVPVQITEADGEREDEMRMKGVGEELSNYLEEELTD